MVRTYPKDAWTASSSPGFQFVALKEPIAGFWHAFTIEVFLFLVGLRQRMQACFHLLTKLCLTLLCAPLTKDLDHITL